MRKSLNVLFIFFSFNSLKNCKSTEFDEKAWLDNRGRNKFYDYAEFAEPKNYYYNIRGDGHDKNNYSSNVDLELFVASTADVCEC